MREYCQTNYSLYVTLYLNGESMVIKNSSACIILWKEKKSTETNFARQKINDQIL